MKKKLNKGFTLVELIVVMCLMGIITTAIAMIMQPANKLYRNVMTKTGSEDACIRVSDYINQRLRYATAVRVVYTDSSTIPGNLDADIYNHCIMISNEVRTDSTGDMEPHGYIRVCDTADMPQTTTIDSYGNEKHEVNPASVNKSIFKKCSVSDLFDKADVHFHVTYGRAEDNGSEAAALTETERDSMSIKFICHPMTQNNQKDGFEIDKDKRYVYKRTFQFMNLRRSIGFKTHNLAIDDVLEKDITHQANKEGTYWIFYQLPTESEFRDGMDPEIHTASSGAPVISTSSVPTIPSGEGGDDTSVDDTSSIPDVSVPDITISIDEPTVSIDTPSEPEAIDFKLGNCQIDYNLGQAGYSFKLFVGDQEIAAAQGTNISGDDNTIIKVVVYDRDGNEVASNSERTLGSLRYSDQSTDIKGVTVVPSDYNAFSGEGDSKTYSGGFVFNYT